MILQSSLSKNAPPQDMTLISAAAESEGSSRIKDALNFKVRGSQDVQNLRARQNSWPRRVKDFWVMTTEIAASFTERVEKDLCFL